MKCLRPLIAYRSGKHESGSQKYRISNPWRFDDPALAVATMQKGDALFRCGRCEGCYADRALQWSMRCFHQESITPGGVFLTLTYDDDHLPGVSLNGHDFTLFVRSLKRRLPDWDRRYLGAGEYGDRTERPHFHGIFWNLPELDLVFHARSPKGHAMFTSDFLTEVWSKGFVTVQAFDASHGGYVASYIAGKWRDDEVYTGPNGRRSDERYDPLISDFVQLAKPFIRPSKRPVGRDWYDVYRMDLFKGWITYKGRQVAIPKTYLKWLKADFPDKYEAIKAKADEFIQSQGYFEGDNSVARLEDRRVYRQEIERRKGFKGYR